MKHLLLRFLILTLLIFNLNLTANSSIKKSCFIPDEIMYSILLSEKTKKRKIGYEFLIRNNSKEKKKLFYNIIKKFNHKEISNNLIDCLNKKNCIKISQELIKKDILNLDLGAYQINNYYHSDNLNIFFNFDKSYFKACGFIEKNITKNGWNWEAVARYHSKTPKHNKKYIKRLQDYLLIVRKQIQ